MAMCLFFFFQAEDGIRDVAVTGVQTCALPISKFTGARIEREGKGLYEGNAFQDAFARGMTIEGLGLRTGDRIVVPRRGDPEHTVRIISLIVAIPVAIFTVKQLAR